MTKETAAIMDFDGAITNLDVPETVETYTAVYTETAAKIMSMPVDELGSLIEAQRETILREPEKYCWRDENGTRLAGANEMTIVTFLAFQRALAELGKTATPEIFSSCYHSARQAMTVVAHPGVGEFIEKILASGLSVAIVSGTEAQLVEQELTELLGKDHGLTVIAGVRKTQVAWSDLTIALSGWPEAVPVLRSDLLRALAQVDDPIAFSVSDQYEMDLIPCLLLGITTVLKQTAHTPEWEKQTADVVINAYSDAWEQVERIVLS